VVSVLNAVTLCLLRHMALRNPAPGERRGASINTGNGVVWVDDFAFWVVVLAHALCAGLEGGCPICLEHLPHAERLDAEWKALCARLGVPLSADKHQPSSQKPDYAGFVFDTVRGVVLCQPDKGVKLLACLAAWLELTEITPQELDSIQGRVLTIHTPSATSVLPRHRSTACAARCQRICTIGRSRWAPRCAIWPERSHRPWSASTLPGALSGGACCTGSF
jgi:hypothetical protein